MGLQNTRQGEKGKTLLKRVRETIASASLLQDERPLVIAVSGGSDSLSLLHILSSLYPHRRRIVVYVDHGLRPDETIQEIELVQQQSEKCGGEFVTVTVDVQAERSQKKYSPEEAARSLRYRALADICERNDACAIAVGHTADDQAEEILLRLIRGSGRSGLSGMR
ncbi:MAG: tRNA lysidine(34) synthetase TilS, partial [Thermodesulfobacteriota bacterium]